MHPSRGARVKGPFPLRLSLFPSASDSLPFFLLFIHGSGSIILFLPLSLPLPPFLRLPVPLRSSSPLSLSSCPVTVNKLCSGARARPLIEVQSPAGKPSRKAATVPAARPRRVTAESSFPGTRTLTAFPIVQASQMQPWIDRPAGNLMPPIVNVWLTLGRDRRARVPLADSKRTLFLLFSPFCLDHSTAESDRPCALRNI